MLCRSCNINFATDKHHVISKKQNGSNNSENLINLCRSCHHEIHFGIDSNKKMKVLTNCYDYIRHNLNKVQKKGTKIPDWKLAHIEQGNYNFIFEKMGLL